MDRRQHLPAGGRADSDANLNLICMPDEGSYNGQVLVFAHGNLGPGQPVGIPYDPISIPECSTLPQLLNSLGSGFAMSSQSVNGWAAKQSIADVLDVANVYSGLQGPALPSRVLMTGASEGLPPDPA